jgi:hypothetical protein
MTHGDKEKAKAGKTQASGSKSISKAAVESKAGENGKSSGKGSVKSAAESKAGAGKVSLKKGSPPQKAAAKAGSAKGGAASQTAAEAKGGDASGKAGSKGRGGGAVEEAPTFSNPVIGDAFRNALKKYPNAFRKLTD